MLTLQEITVLGAVVKLGWSPKRSELAEEVSGLLLEAFCHPKDTRSVHAVMDALLTKGLLRRIDGGVTLSDRGRDAYGSYKLHLRRFVGKLP